jgi:hypothetical protein
MPIPFPVLNTIQPLLGVDIHNSVPPFPPAPMPHVLVWGVGLSAKMGFLQSPITSKAASPDALHLSKTVGAGWGYAVGRQHDAGPHGGHIWTNTLLPVIALGSGSKNQFGAGTVKTPNHGAQTADLAVGMLWVTDMSLDCSDPVPLPTGRPVTAANTVRAGMTWADVGRGAVSMVTDFGLTAASSFIGGKVLGWAGKLAGNTAVAAMLSGNSLVGKAGRAVVAAAVALGGKSKVATVASQMLGGGLSYVMGAFGVGSPLGYSAGYTPGGRLAGAADTWADGLFRPPAAGGDKPAAPVSAGKPNP